MDEMKQALQQEAAHYAATAPGGAVGPETTDDPALQGMRYFTAPLFGFAAAEDPLFAALRAPEAVGEQLILPQEWLPGAKTVISFFLPFSEQVRRSNLAQPDLPSPEWLYARIEGQAFLLEICRLIADWLQQRGFSALIPAVDPRMQVFHAPKFTSSWSERHAAYVAGLGTFGLSCGLITEQGMSGRFGSVITDAVFSPDQRPYDDPYAYCNHCGVCVRRCPVAAISLRAGKDHQICSDYLDQMKEHFQPRYGCGKCQSGVPCEKGIPQRIR